MRLGKGEGGCLNLKTNLGGGGNTMTTRGAWGCLSQSEGRPIAQMRFRAGVSQQEVSNGEKLGSKKAKGGTLC